MTTPPSVVTSYLQVKHQAYSPTVRAARVRRAQRYSTFLLSDGSRMRRARTNRVELDTFRKHAEEFIEGIKAGFIQVLDDQARPLDLEQVIALAGVQLPAGKSETPADTEKKLEELEETLEKEVESSPPEPPEAPAAPEAPVEPPQAEAAPADLPPEVPVAPPVEPPVAAPPPPPAAPVAQPVPVAAAPQRGGKRRK